jgi:hypothetical protein
MLKSWHDKILSYLLVVIHHLILRVELLISSIWRFLAWCEAFCLPFSCVLVEDWYYLVHYDMGPKIDNVMLYLSMHYATFYRNYCWKFLCIFFLSWIYSCFNFFVSLDLLCYSFQVFYSSIMCFWPSMTCTFFLGWQKIKNKNVTDFYFSLLHSLYEIQLNLINLVFCNLKFPNIFV